MVGFLDFSILTVTCFFVLHFVYWEFFQKKNSKELIEQITSKINIPQPDTVKLNNVKANVMVSDGQNVPAQILEISKEPFDTNSETSSNSYNWNYKDLVLIVIIVIIIYLLIFRK